MARLAMEQVFSEARNRRCSCARIGTGVRNPAHALYRSFGYVDEHVSQDLFRTLESEPAVPGIKGIRVRCYRSGDEQAMAGLFNARYADCRGAPWKEPTPPHGRHTGLLALKGGEPAGYVLAHGFGERAWVHELAIAEDDHAPAVAAALVGTLHARLWPNGIRRIELQNGWRTVAPLLYPLGYSHRETGGVDMFALVNLPQFLEEITPLLERRLERNGWSGTVTLRGDKHRAGLDVRKSHVTVLPTLPRRADVCLCGSDDSITRVAGGIFSPYELYLQRELRVEPMLTEPVRKLLEHLFPHMRNYR
jgi:hypothetical protein